MNTTSVHDEPPVEPGRPSPAIASRAARRGASWIWWGLSAAIAAIIGIAVVSAASRSDDRGIRGPGDQAAPEAPRNEKVPPSTVR